MNDTLLQLPSPILFVGVGNTLKSDDGAGPVAAGRLAAAGIDALDCGEVPENYLRRIISHRGGSIVFIDAVEMNAVPGTLRLFTANDIAITGVFTHGMSLAMLAEFVQKEAGVPVYLAGIQPARVELGETLSPVVEKAVDRLVQLIVNRQDGGK
jgi:hydrogenase 3 maturation protease